MDIPRHLVLPVGWCEIGDLIEVDTGEHWIEMEVKRDYEGYYLEGKRIAFYPKMVLRRWFRNSRPEAEASGYKMEGLCPEMR